MKNNKILIIGFGNMGLSHFNSFVKKNFIIHIVEKKINEKIINLKKHKLFNKKIFIFKNIQPNQKYLLVVSATTSKERLYLIKKFFKNNKTKYLLLEKFCFSSISQFSEFKKKYSQYTKTFVNSWGNILAKKIRLKKKNLDSFSIKCTVKEDNLLGNITHILHFFSYLNNKQPIKNFVIENFKIIKNSKRKSYDELRVTIKIKDFENNQMIIQTKKNIKNLISFSILKKIPKINKKLIIKNNNSIHIYNSGEKVNEIKFPFSSITSLIFLKKAIDKNYEFLPSFEDDFNLSKMILKKLKVKIS